MKHLFVEMGASGMVVFYRTERAFKNIVLFWVLCALNKDCTQPTKQLYCNGEKLRRGKFVGKLHETIDHLPSLI